MSNDTDRRWQLDRRSFTRALAVSSLGTSLAGCSSSEQGGGTTEQVDGGSSSGSGEVDVDALAPDELLGKGPMGHSASPADSVELSSDQISELRDGDFTVSIVYQYGKTAWVRLHQQAHEKRFEELGITVEGEYDPEFDASQQSNILNTVAQKDNVDAVVSIPVDRVATAKGYRNVAQAGKEIVFMDNVPKGFEHGSDYAGTVSSDNQGLGVFAGRYLREFIGEGKVGIIPFDAPFYVTTAREEGAKDVLKEASDIEIVAENGFTNPDNIYGIAQNMLTANPDIKGLFVSWSDPPGTQAATGAKDAGVSDIAITTTDFTRRAAGNMAKGGAIKATGAQFPYQQGIIEANMVGHALLGNDTPAFIASGVLPTARSNLLNQYPRHFQEEPPESITNHYE